MFVNQRANPNSANLMTPQEVVEAKERGRKMAAEAIRINPESRRRVESTYGIEHCKRRYPEAYPTA